MRLALAPLSLLVLLACAGEGSGTPPAPLTVGLVLPLAVERPLGYELAAAELNAAGGLLGGRPIRLAVADDELEPERAAEETRRLIEEEGAVAILGVGRSSLATAILPVAQDHRVPVISCCATADSFTLAEPEYDRWFFRTVPPDGLQSVVLAKYASESGCGRLGILYVDDAYGAPLAADVAAGFEARGGSVVARIPYEDDAPTYAAEVAQLVDATPDCTIFVGFERSAGTVFNDWNELDPRPDWRWIGTDGIKTALLTEFVGDPTIIDGLEGTAPDLRGSMGRFERLGRMVESAFGVGVDTFDPPKYDALALLAFAVEQAGTDDPAAVRDALFAVSRPDPGDAPVIPGELVVGLRELREGGGVDYRGAGGPVDFDGQGNVVTAYEIWRFDAALGFQTLDTVSPESLE